MLGGPVKNETGLTAVYDLKLEYTAETPVPPGPEPEAAATAGDRPSIFTALTEQLGLRLHPRKGPVPVYEVERLRSPAKTEAHTLF